MNKLNHFTKKYIKSFNKNWQDPQGKMLNLIALSFLVLILGGIVLFFTKNSVPKDPNAIEYTCKDTDGYDIHKKGAVTYTDATGRHTDEDYCSPGVGSLYEMTCHKTSFWSFSSVSEKQTVTCPKGCNNGACIK